MKSADSDDGSSGSPQLVVVGIGNVLRGDDAVGYLVAEKLEGLYSDPRLWITSCHTLLPELAEPISRSRLCVFVDASLDLPPGAVRRDVIEPPRFVTLSQMHHLTPDVLLECARRLFKRCPRGLVIRIGIECTAHRQELSPTARRACTSVVGRLRRLIARELPDVQSVRNAPETGGAVEGRAPFA